MASTGYLDGLFLIILAMPCFSGVCCKSDQSPMEVVASAMACFDYHYVSCQESHRLNAGGSINVSRHTIDEYCRGPCLVETKLVLNCVNNKLQSFRFYNGATVQNMKYILNTGCSYTNKRGNFNFVEYFDNFPDAYGNYPGGYDDYPGGGYDVFCDEGNELAVVLAFDLLMLLTCYSHLMGY